MLLGDTELGVRAPAIVCSLGSSLVLFLLGRCLHSQKVGILSAAIFQFIPVYAFLSLGMTTDPPFVFMWLLALLFMLGAWRTGSALSWALAGLAVGLGIMVKYTMTAFLLPAFLLLIFSSARRQLLTPWPYLGLLVCMVTTSPLIIWNADHGWVNLFHNAGQTKVSSGLRIQPGQFLEFAGSQLGIITPVLLVMMVFAAVRLRRLDPLSFWFTIPLMFLFMLKSAQGKVETNWALCCYPAGIISFSAYFPGRFKELSVGLRRWTITAVAIAVCFTVLMHTACLITFPEKMDPLKKVRLGSVGLGVEVSRLTRELGPRYFIFSDRYMTSSLLAFYTGGHPTTYCVNLNRRINDYDFRPTFHNLIGCDAIYVIPGDRKMPEKLIDKFGQYEKRLVKTKSAVGSIENVYSVFLCRDFKGMAVEMPTKYN
jgi:undecaprenyl-diphosphatase